PAKLRVSSSIEKEAVIVGIENKLEIWDKGRWDKEMGDMDDGVADELPDEDLIEFEF
ncbi:MAG: cell division/cell wall cluster transcriptional repressor MraZ, partial [Nitrospinae bacterium]|nr:cell division/cell wall cluster transcriptional repressor MraZ [Nitrospinota bacterium]